MGSAHCGAAVACLLISLTFFSGEARSASSSTSPVTNDALGTSKSAGAPAEELSDPILLVTSAAAPISRYYAEILRTEGLAAFSDVDVSNVTAALLKRVNLVLLADIDITPEQAGLLREWVEAGGRLIAMRPRPLLAGLLGLRRSGEPVKEGYLLADRVAVPSRGITHSTLQIHGAADRYDLVDGVEIARLFSDATSALPDPAVTLRNVGSRGGQAAAFVYDLARSVVYTRQGNPEWAGQERDGIEPVRPDDMFFPDYVNMDKVAIPQADEQQRLLANLAVAMMQSVRPLPRFWYLPGARAAAIVMVGDDHRTGGRGRLRRLLSWIRSDSALTDSHPVNGTASLFNRLIAESPANCSIERWECLRATSYLFNGTALWPSDAAAYHNQGFEIGVHVDSGCADKDPTSLRTIFDRELRTFHATYPSLPQQATHRLHCVAWPGWTDVAKIERERGMRLDLNYYYWPPRWVRDRPGFFTGSGFPMRFVDSSGAVIDIYQAATHLVNENGVNYPAGIEVMLDRALGPDQFFGVFGTHYDYTDAFADQLVETAKSRHVALISAQQLLTWLDGRGNSHFSEIAWKHNALTFDVSVSTGADGLYGMVPELTEPGSLSSITCNGKPVEHFVRTVKGLDYAFFPVRSGRCIASYGLPE